MSTVNSKTTTELEYSRPLDVHRWSDHPEVNQFINKIWNEYLERHFKTSGGVGKRPKSSLKKQFKVLLLHLYIEWKQDPELLISVSRSKSAYKAGSRYNALHISYKIVEVIDYLEAVGLIQQQLGNELSQRVTRIWPTTKLISLFETARFSFFDIVSHQDKEVIVLNVTTTEEIVDDQETQRRPKKKSKPVEYNDEDYEPIRQMRSDLRSYNKLLHNTFVDIGSLEVPNVNYEYWDRRKQKNVVKKIPIGHQNKFVRRVFYRGDWNLGGRFHGGFWQQINEDWRSQILINDQPTVEQDFSGLHINLAYGLKQQRPPDEDPYILDLMFEVDPKVQRKWVKGLTLVAINAADEESAYLAFRNNQQKGSSGKRLRNNQLKILLDAFKEKHKTIEDFICTDQGVHLMKIDGNITSRIINHFTIKSLPILTVHDSYITSYDLTGELRTTMNQSIKEELNGYEINIDQDYMGVDQLRSFLAMDPNLDRRSLYDSLPKITRCSGYTRRLEEHVKWQEHVNNR
jgi:hypothetical protein